MVDAEKTGYLRSLMDFVYPEEGIPLEEVECETYGSLREADETAVTYVALRHCIEVAVSNDVVSHVTGEVDAIVEAKDIEETRAHCILPVGDESLSVSTYSKKTCRHVRNEIPETGLFVTTDGVGNVPEEVTMKDVERNLLLVSEGPL